MNTTQNMGLLAWDLGSDSYDHNQLANNWVVLDTHNHNPAQGGGAQIGSGGLQDLSVTTAKIANNAVTGAKIAPGSIDLSKLSSGALSSIGPIGEVIEWWRPSAATPIPAGWAIPTGQNVVAGQHDYPLAESNSNGSIDLPNLTNVFILGAVTSGGGSGPTDAPNIGDRSGSNTLSLAHSHTVNSHSHIVDSHSHGVSAHSHSIAPHSHTDTGHSHSVSNHSHGIGGDGGHNHLLRYRYNLPSNFASANPGSGQLQTLYIGGTDSEGNPLNANDGSVGGVPAHSHGGSTGGSTPPTSVAAASISATGLVTDPASGSTTAASPSTSAVSPGTSSALGAVDSRPQFVGLLRLIRIKRS